MTERRLLLGALAALLDLVLLGLVWVLAVWIRLGVEFALPGLLPGLGVAEAWRAGVVVVVSAWTMARVAPVAPDRRGTLVWLLRSGALALAGLYLLRTPHLSRTLLIGFGALAPGGLWLSRRLCAGIAAGGWARHPVLVFGAPSPSPLEHGVLVGCGRLDPARPALSLFEALKTTPAAEVRLAPGAAASLDRIAGLCAELGVDLVVEGPEGQRLRFASHRLVARAIKRVLDVLGAAVLLVLTSPVLGAAAVAIWWGGGGPVVLRQARAGRFGVTFPMFKLRTMVVDAPAQRAALEAHNEADGPVFKLRRDPRVTRVGRVLRRWSIDELPQLVNVLRGEMSLVGPRPPLLEEVARYTRAERRRLAERPGLTCTWQVSGRSDLGWQTWLAMDLAYVDRWTLWGDLLLLLRTVPAVLSGRGAR